MKCNRSNKNWKNKQNFKKLLLLETNLCYEIGYYDREKICRQFRLLIWTSFIVQFVRKEIRGLGKGSRWRYRYFSLL